MLQLRGGDYKDYFDFIFLTLASISYKLTEKNIRENEFTYHLRFTTINGALINSIKGITLNDHIVQTTGNLNL